MRALFVLAFVAVCLGLIGFFWHTLDNGRADKAVETIAAAKTTSRDGLEKSYSQAKGEAASIRSSALRAQALAEIDRIYQERGRAIDAIEALRREERRKRQALEEQARHAALPRSRDGERQRTPEEIQAEIEKEFQRRLADMEKELAAARKAAQ